MWVTDKICVPEMHLWPNKARRKWENNFKAMNGRPLLKTGQGLARKILSRNEQLI